VTLQLHVANSAGCCGLADLLTAQRLARRSGGDVLLAAPTASVHSLPSLRSMDEALGRQSRVDAAVAYSNLSRAAGTSANSSPARGDG